MYTYIYTGDGRAQATRGQGRRCVPVLVIDVQRKDATHFLFCYILSVNLETDDNYPIFS